MIQFTTDFLTSWRLEGYTYLWIQECLPFRYITIYPTHEDIPEKLKVMFNFDAYPICAPIVDTIASGKIRDDSRYFVSNSYDLYRNFDPGHIDMEADFWYYSKEH